MDMFEDATSDSERQIQAAQLFALAEKYDVETAMLNIGIKLHAHGNAPGKKKQPAGSYYETDRFPPERRAVEIAYRDTHRDSILRIVFVDWYSMGGVDDDIGVRDWLPTVPEFASDLVVTRSRQQRYFDKNEDEYLKRLTGKAYKVL